MQLKGRRGQYSGPRPGHLAGRQIDSTAGLMGGKEEGGGGVCAKLARCKKAGGAYRT